MYHNILDSDISDYKLLPKLASKRSLDRSYKIMEAKPLDRLNTIQETTNTHIKIGKAKTLKPTTVKFENPQQIFKQFNEIANKNTTDSQGKMKDEIEIESSYTEEFEDD
jgi:hypothetical protein